MFLRDIQHAWTQPQTNIGAHWSGVPVSKAGTTLRVPLLVYQYDKTKIKAYLSGWEGRCQSENEFSLSGKKEVLLKNTFTC